MKTILLLIKLTICLLIISSCNTQSTCEKNNTGTLGVTSTSTNPYTITIDGNNRGVVNGGGGASYDLSVGSHTVTATQNSGYLLYATVKTNTVNINQCQTTGFTFP